MTEQGNKRAFEVVVFLKEGLLDPQGRAVREALNQLGLAADEVRVGRAIRVVMEDTPENRTRLEEIAREFLANPVIETARVREREGEDP